MDISIFKDKRIYLVAIGLLCVISSWFVLPPFNFPENSIITVNEGDGLLTVANRLERDGVIRSPFWFRIVSIILGGERDMKAGQYYMSHPQNVFTIAWRILHGTHGVEVVRLTIPEGFTVDKISNLFDEKFILFDNEEFVRLAKEGCLFPDTYFVPLTATASSTIKLLTDNFERKISSELPNIESSGRSLEEIITMASILEGEAKTKEDREIVSGILWNRIRIGMALQVDASFVYINGKTTKDLTLEDLKIDSPYNTYLYRGLPPTPISNPGLESIQAAINPANTPYLYFLTADDGTMHYSQTHDEHVAKKLIYLR